MHDKSEDVTPDEVVDAVLTASRVLVAVAAESLAAAERQDVSLPQYRVLVLIAARGPQRVADLAEALGVNPSTATRVCDRLYGKGLIHRRRPPGRRREVRISLSDAGVGLVDEVTRRRRDGIARLLAAVPGEQRAAVVHGLRALADAAGEIPDPDWALGWN
ncbi:MAG: MarR family winged helix-turn-helix transcriptional regulator [Thermoleophilia bacterium]